MLQQASSNSIPSELEKAAAKSLSLKLGCENYVNLCNIMQSRWKQWQYYDQ